METAGDCVWRREVIGSDKGGKKGRDETGGDEGGASKEMTRRTHLTAVYPASLASKRLKKAVFDQANCFLDQWMFVHAANFNNNSRQFSQSTFVDFLKVLLAFLDQH